MNDLEQGTEIDEQEWMNKNGGSGGTNEQDQMTRNGGLGRGCWEICNYCCCWHNLVTKSETGTDGRFQVITQTLL